jgi:hypothetical protein
MGPAGEVEGVEAKLVHSGMKSLTLGQDPIVFREGLTGLGQLDAAKLDANYHTLLRESLGVRNPREPATQASRNQHDGFSLSFYLVEKDCLIHSFLLAWAE